MGQAESKLGLRKYVVQLLAKNIPASNDDFWSQFWLNPITAEDIVALVQPTDIRKLRQSQPHNLATLLTKLIKKLESVVAEGPVDTGRDIAGAINCCHVLTRILPFVFEHDADGFNANVFWLNRPPQLGTAEARGRLPSSADHGEGGEDDEFSAVAAEIEEVVEGDRAGSSPTQPLAHILIDSLMTLCFLHGACVEHPSQVVRSKGDGTPAMSIQVSLLWEAGLLKDTSPSVSHALIVNRFTVLRCLLVTMSASLYANPDNVSITQNPWLRYAVSSECPHTYSLFYSLLNTICHYDPYGMGIPYAAIFTVDPRESLVDAALQLICVFLDFRLVDEHGNDTLDVPAMPQSQGPGGEAGEPLPPSVVRVDANIYRRCLRALEQPMHFDTLYQGLIKILSNQHITASSILPGSYKKLYCYQEAMILFWKTIDLNRPFLLYIIQNHNICDYVTPCLYFIYDARKDPSRAGLVHVGVFSLLLLSGERDFGVSLNTPFSTKLPLDLPVFTGNHADLLFVVFHKLMVNERGRLSSLYDCLLTVFCNVSPYIKTVSMVASVKLLNLFELFSSPKFLYAAEKNHRHVFFLLEVFNNLLQYQFHENMHIVYAILRRKHVFENLAQIPPLEDTGAEAVTDEPPTLDSVIGRSQLDEAAEWKPTQAWIRSWKSRMPLQVVMVLLQQLLPRVEAFCRREKTTEESQILKFLRSSTMVGLLPVPHPILIRKYQPNEFTDLWFTTYLWGVIYVRNQNPPLFDGNTIRLFQVQLIKYEQGNPVDERPVNNAAAIGDRPGANAQQGGAPAASGTGQERRPEATQGEQRLPAGTTTTRRTSQGDEPHDDDPTVVPASDVEG